MTRLVGLRPEGESAFKIPPFLGGPAKFIKRLFGSTTEGSFKSGNAGGTRRDYQEYLEAISKYIPVEILAAYLATEQILNTYEDRNEVSFLVIMYVSFFVCLTLAPTYVHLFEGKSKKTHSVMAFIAFPIWAYAMKGMIFLHSPLGDIYIAQFAFFLLIMFSLISGCYRPRSRDS